MGLIHFNPPTPNITFPNPGKHQKDVTFSNVLKYENAINRSENVKK